MPLSEIRAFIWTRLVRVSVEAGSGLGLIATKNELLIASAFAEHLKDRKRCTITFFDRGCLFCKFDIIVSETSPVLSLQTLKLVSLFGVSGPDPTFPGIEDTLPVVRLGISSAIRRDVANMFLPSKNPSGLNIFAGLIADEESPGGFFRLRIPLNNSVENQAQLLIGAPVFLNERLIGVVCEVDDPYGRASYLRCVRAFRTNE